MVLNSNSTPSHGTLWMIAGKDVMMVNNISGYDSMYSDSISMISSYLYDHGMLFHWYSGSILGYYEYTCIIMMSSRESVRWNECYLWLSCVCHAGVREMWFYSAMKRSRDLLPQHASIIQLGKSLCRQQLWDGILSVVDSIVLASSPRELFVPEEVSCWDALRTTFIL